MKPSTLPLCIYAVTLGAVLWGTGEIVSRKYFERPPEVRNEQRRRIYLDDIVDVTEELRRGGSMKHLTRAEMQSFVVPADYGKEKLTRVLDCFRRDLAAAGIDCDVKLEYVRSSELESPKAVYIAAQAGFQIRALIEIPVRGKKIPDGLTKDYRVRLLDPLMYDDLLEQWFTFSVIKVKDSQKLSVAETGACYHAALQTLHFKHAKKPTGESQEAQKTFFENLSLYAMKEHANTLGLSRDGLQVYEQEMSTDKSTVRVELPTGETWRQTLKTYAQDPCGFFQCEK